jgi:chaperone LolA
MSPKSEPIRRLLRHAARLGACVSAAVACSLAQTDLDAALAGLQRRYAAVETVQADFVQTYRAPGIDQRESGTLCMKKPGLMRWEYRDPEVKQFIADGRETFLYVPADRQVFVRRFSASELRSTPLQLLLGRGDLRRDFEVAWEQRPAAGAAETVILRLTPRKADAEYAYVVIACDARNFDLQRILIRETAGNTSEFVLTHLRTNGKVDGRQFQFKIPKGVEVVRLDEK